ncbi:MAG: hypothetical protein OXM60_03340 [Defluviicoccus sp.]|nr:hypothetical protein [Defluviicoccus sp.]MDE0172444.1 hypothetical protein [Defluviicoccus sp.]
MQTMTPELLAVLVTMLGIGVALAALILTVSARGISRLDQHIAEAAADRRAFQASMDEYRRDMQRFGERQARVEAIHDHVPPAAPAE